MDVIFNARQNHNQALHKIGSIHISIRIFVLIFGKYSKIFHKFSQKLYDYKILIWKELNTTLHGLGFIWYWGMSLCIAITQSKVHFNCKPWWCTKFSMTLWFHYGTYPTWRLLFGKNFASPITWDKTVLLEANSALVDKTEKL